MSVQDGTVLCIAVYGIVSAKRDLTHVFSRFQLLSFIFYKSEMSYALRIEISDTWSCKAVDF